MPGPRVTGTPPTFELSCDEAGRITPRLLRLAVRPNQNGDAYIRKLCELIAGDLAVRATAIRKARSVRQEPTLERLHGMEEAVAWGLTLKTELASYADGTRDWADIDRGLLLSGAPGTGKSLFARALAVSCGVPLISGSYATWIGNGTGHQGDLIRAMRASFREAKEKAPSILFIDEVDSFQDRARVSDHHRDWSVQVVNALLAEVDGVEDREGVVILAACNDPGRLDPALVRAGRLDHHILIGRPDRGSLALILREHLGTDLGGEALDQITLLALGFTGADAEKAVRGARRRARSAGRLMAMGDLTSEIVGQDRRTPDELRLAAVHEAGHAVAAYVLGIVMDGLTLRQSGFSGGQLFARAPAGYLAGADVHDQLVMLLSGRAAEDVIVRRVTSGAGGAGNSDLALATRLAARSAVELGLEEDYGLIWSAVPERQEDLRRLFTANHRLADLIRIRLAGAYESAVSLMERHRVAILALADLLAEQIAMDPEQIARVLQATGCRR